SIDLVGESQLVQKRYTPSQVSGSILDVTSSGYLERDQQGTTNLYNYNYWSSPIGPINSSSNNNPYNIGTILRDGTNSASPVPISWISNSYDASGTIPIGLSNRWIYTYENYPADIYAEWSYKGDAGNLDVGLSFTMKGSGVGDPVTDVQNYVFTGKPNNGTISTPVTSGNQALVGNPYPSAIDAFEFIMDNMPGGNAGTSGSIDGTLYFWVHYDSNFTHILEDYEGGYAVYNLTGGLAAVAPPLVSGLGSSSEIPGDYIAVSQGFFVTSASSQITDQVTFNNDQRYFERETANSVFLKSSSSNSKKNNSLREDLRNSIKRIRLEFKTPDGATRPLLLGFVPNKLATDGFDYGYDGENSDEFSPNDMAFMIQNKKYVIQGVGDFDKTKQYPIGIFLSTSGSFEIALKALENFDSEVDVFVYDALLETYTRINDSNYQMSLDPQYYLDRFFITFVQDEASLDITDTVLENTIVNYLNNTDEIYINVPNTIDVKQVYLINLLGQTVKSWNITNMPNLSSNEFKIPVKNVASGAYIIKVVTDTSTINKKIIIKQ
ncbi:MAG: T9SS type A sorting domain-containing protein, partial [Flavobacteriaceae bacterium]|nr:T9SS type A sorting domain-containing protein [Flavobacteriaceae bacterium]